MFERYLKPLSPKIKAFTLIEILVVISILALLMAMLFPALNMARERANRAVCLANLRSIGQCLYLYAQDNRGMLVPGDTWQAWDAWGPVSAPAGCSSTCRQVNLGHLVIDEFMTMPRDGKHNFFCPSGSDPSGDSPPESFLDAWGQNDSRATIGYMFNSSLDGFDDFVQSGDYSVLSHYDVINFLKGDGSSNTFKVKKLTYDSLGEKELIQEVCQRYGVCFPVVLLHRWLENGQIDLDQAGEYLSDPQMWAAQNSTSYDAKPIFLAHLGKKSLVCDVVGVWGDAPGPGPPGPPPPPPPPG